MNIGAESNGAALTAARLRRLLDDMAADAGAGATAASLYLTPADAADDAQRGRPAPVIPPFLLPWRGGPEWTAALRPGCGLAALRAGRRGLLIAPPFPVTQSRFAPQWDDAPLRRILDADFTVGAVLVRLGRFSVAKFRRGQLLASKTDSRYVKGRHHAGGTSQLRYTRVREGQIHRLYGKVCDAARELLSPPPDYLILGGERFTLNGLLKECPALAQAQAITLHRRLNIRDPKRDTLPQVAAMLTESRGWQLEFD